MSARTEPVRRETLTALSARVSLSPDRVRRYLDTGEHDDDVALWVLREIDQWLGSRRWEVRPRNSNSTKG